jgi:hypothetical protein
MFRYLRTLHIVFQSDCTSLHSHQQCTKVPFPHVLGDIFDDSCSKKGEENLSVVFICISYMDRDDENFFMCFLAI